jgi:hypothetical protein
MWFGYARPYNCLKDLSEGRDVPRPGTPRSRYLRRGAGSWAASAISRTRVIWQLAQ